MVLETVDSVLVTDTSILSKIIYNNLMTCIILMSSDLSFDHDLEQYLQSHDEFDVNQQYHAEESKTDIL